MAAVHDQHAMTSDEIQDAFDRLGPEQGRRRGAFAVAAGKPLKLVWANAAAADLFGADDRRATLNAILARSELDIIREPVGRTERFRFFEGFRSRTLTLTLGRTVLTSGRQVTAIAVPDYETAAGPWTSSVLFAAGRESGGEIGFDPDQAAPAAEAAPAAGASPSSAHPPRASAGQRFLWRTDAQGRVVEVAQGAAELAGLGDRSLVGWVLPDFLARWGCDADGLLAKAMADGTVWSGLHLAWPLADGSGAAAVVLGAVPVLGAERTVDGFRGFGVADVARVTPLAGSSVSVEAEPSASAQDVWVEGEHRTADHAGPVSAAQTAMPDQARSSLAPDRYSSKVVVLRPYQTVAPLSGAAVLSRRRPDNDDASGLSPSERSAFAEIGLALGGHAAPGVPPAGAPRSTSSGLGALLNALPVAVWWREDGPARVNPAFLRMTGDGSAEAFEARGGIERALAGFDPSVLADGEDRDLMVLDASDHARPVTVRRITRAGDGGSLTAVTLTAGAGRGTDGLVEAAGEVLARLDDQARLVTINRAGELLFGRPCPDLVGCSLVDLLAPDSRHDAEAVFRAAATCGDAQPTTLRSIRPDGTVATLLMTARRIGPGDICAVLRDETATERLRADHAAALESLDRAHQDKADFLSKLSHDVRTPLNAVLGFAEVILDERFGPVGSPRYRDYLLDIHRSGSDVLALVNDLLDLSKMEAGRFEVSLEAVDVNRVVADNVAALQADAHRQRVILRTSLLPRLPTALVDEGALRQMMANILSNAVKFNEPGGQVIVSTAVNDAGAVAIRIRDTGVGMSEAEVAAAIDPLSPATTAAGAATGNGLGLPLTKALAEANGGTMVIRSRKGEGTFVEIVLRSEPIQPVRVPAA